MRSVKFVAKGAERYVFRWGIHNMPGLNKLFLWGDDLFGYCKRRNSEQFWEKR